MRAGMRLAAALAAVSVVGLLVGASFAQQSSITILGGGGGAAANPGGSAGQIQTNVGGTSFGGIAFTDDSVLVGNGSAWQLKALPDCDDTGGNHLNYDTGTNAFSCGTSGSGGGSGTVTSITNGGGLTFSPTTITTAGSITLITPVAVVSGGTNLTAALDDNVMVGSGTTWQSKAVPDCDDAGGNHLNYDTATNAFSCGNSSSAGGGSVTSLTAGTADVVLSPTTITTVGTISTKAAFNAQTGTTYTISSSDAGKLLTFSNTSGTTVTIPQAGTTGFEDGFRFCLVNIATAANLTLTPSGTTLNGTTASKTFPQWKGGCVASNGSAYRMMIGGGTALLNEAQSWYGTQAVSPGQLFYSASIAWDASVTNNWFLTANSTGGTLANPTNLMTGSHFMFAITGTITSPTLAYGSFFKFPGGTAPTLSATTGSVDLLSCYARTNLTVGCQMLNDLR